MRAAWTLAGVVLLAPTAASAETLEVDRFEPARELELLGVQGIDLDTGWQPSSGNIQVRFLTHADDNILIEMPGDAVFDWDSGEVHFVGDEDAGVLDVDIGVLLDARFRFDLLGQQFESSFIGPYELGIFQEASYTPYLLPGNDDRPLLIDDETTPVEVFNYAIVDVVIASGNFFVDASFDIDMQLNCERIDVTDVDGVEAGSILSEFEPLNAAEPDTEMVELLASLHCTLVSNVELILYPGVELEIAFQDFQLAPFELRIPLLDNRTDAVDFEPLPISFDMPPVDMPVGSTGEGSSGGDESGDDPSDTSGSDGDSAGGSTSVDLATSGGSDTSGGSSGSTGADSARSSDSADGCGCMTGEPSRSAGALFFILLLLQRRRSPVPEFE